MSELIEARSATTIGNDNLPYSFISALHHRFSDKIFDPTQDETATERLLSLRQEWRSQDLLTVFTSGVFDLLHMDHMAYLLHVKATGAAVQYDRQGHRKLWDELEPKQQQDYTIQALSERAIRLVVSIDGDKSVAVRKGSKPEKSGIPTPIYGWKTRAMMVAGLSFVDPNNEGGDLLLPTVDAVTIHGPQDFSLDSPHSSHFELVSRLQPDVWTMFGESTDILDEAPHRPSLASIALCCIGDGEGTHYFEDINMGKMSTTKTARRIRGV